MQEVSRHVKHTVQLMLWGISAGRCEFDGCNKPLWKSSVTQEVVNIAEKAHIWSFSESGPRGNKGIDIKNINDFSNLILVCHDCHKLIDQDINGDKYSVNLLSEMKQNHEQRIALATSISPSRASHILLYGANVGENTSPVSFGPAAEAMFPDNYPAEDHPLLLGLTNNVINDSDNEFFKFEKIQLERQFNKTVRPRLKNNEISHLSVFALAPQPLLILLGKLLSDITSVSVYQRHREPTTWKWKTEGDTLGIKVNKPDKIYQVVALNISLSAKISNDRIYKKLGKEVSVWKLTTDNPHNDFLKNRNQLQKIREIFRHVYAEIKHIHGHETALHVFPAMPVSAAVEFGRVIMPKADMKLNIYDEINKEKGFMYTINI